MRSALPLLLFGLALPAFAQKPVAVNPVLELAKPSRTLKGAMLAELSNPKAQIAIGVTDTQRDLQSIRLAATAMETSLDFMRVAVQATEADGVTTFSAFFSTSPATSLYAFLAENRLAKLRRLTLAEMPLSALVTDEVAFALTLTAAQRKGLDALFAREAKEAANPARPSVKLLVAAMKEVGVAIAKLGDDGGDEAITDEMITKIRPIFARMFRTFERASQLRLKEAPLKHSDPLKLLTAAQVRRYRALAGTTAVLQAPSARVAKRG